jgi:succinyl-CoA synthetase beta subunit
MRCDVVAEGVVQASKELNVTKPIVIRLVYEKVIKTHQYATNLSRILCFAYQFYVSVSN